MLDSGFRRNDGARWDDGCEGPLASRSRLVTGRARV